MNLSSNVPAAPAAAPAAPNTQKVAIGLLVAESMSKSNDANQKQLQSQKEIDQQLMEQNISNAVQQIIENAPDHQTALNEIKSFLGNLNADDSTWGSDIQGWIASELNTANSYSPSQDLVNQLSDDMQAVAQDVQDLQNNENTLNAAVATKNADIDRMQAYEREIGNVPWYKQIEYGLIIAGLGVAIGAVSIAIAFDQGDVDNAREALKEVQQNAALDKQKLQNDPALTNHLTSLASSNNVLQQESSENITDYRSAVNVLQAFDKSMVGLIEEFTESAGVSAAGGA